MLKTKELCVANLPFITCLSVQCSSMTSVQHLIQVNFHFSVSYAHKIQLNDQAIAFMYFIVRFPPLRFELCV